MKRTGSWVIGVGGVGLVLAVILHRYTQDAGMAMAAPEAKKAEPAASIATPATPAPKDQAAGKTEEKIVYTFADDDKVKDFTKLWQQRQGIVVRMTVLQAYWNEEQASLTELNKKLSTDYKLDPTKNYFLDAQRRTLIEREAPPAPEASKPTKP